MNYHGGITSRKPASNRSRSRTKPWSPSKSLISAAKKSLANLGRRIGVPIHVERGGEIMEMRGSTFVIQKAVATGMLIGLKVDIRVGTRVSVANPAEMAELVAIRGRGRIDLEAICNEADMTAALNALVRVDQRIRANSAHHHHEIVAE
jgi:hypothetical protein